MRITIRGRWVALAIAMLALAIAIGLTVMAIDTIIDGAAEVRLRRGGRVRFSGPWAYLHAVNGLLFGGACLCFSAGMVLTTSSRHASRSSALLRFARVLLIAAGGGALMLAVAWLIAQVA